MGQLPKAALNSAALGTKLSQAWIQSLLDVVANQQAIGSIPVPDHNKLSHCHLSPQDTLETGDQVAMFAD